MRGIYKWTNNVNGKVYIGQSVNIASRIRGYRHEINKGSQRPIIRALRKYGFENFTFEIIEECSEELFKEDFTKKEQGWIDFYKSQNKEKGYNIRNADDSNFSEGSQNPKARLNEEKVLAIREFIFIMNIPPSEVYKMYSNEISWDAFCKAYRGDTWKKVDNSMIINRNGLVLRKNLPKAKLTKEEVGYIRYRHETLGESISEIFEDYLGKCTRDTIKRVVTYETWKNILPNPVSTIPQV